MTRQATAQVQQTPTNNPLSQDGILQRKCTSCGQHKTGGGTCPKCRSNGANTSAPVLPMIQTKLTVGAPNDKYEREADRVAEQIMRMPEPNLQSQVDKGEEDEKLLQTKPFVQRKVSDGNERGEAPIHVHRVLQMQGQSLEPSTRQFMESRFGYDFSKVRIHTGVDAFDSARAINARAFTVGRDIVFGADQYQPKQFEGQKLLAHELVHTIQQSGGQRHRSTDVTPSIQQDTQKAQLMRAPVFGSTLKICHQYLRSRTFQVTQGGIQVTVNAAWGPETEGDPMPHGCREDRSFSIELRDRGIFLDEPWGTCDFEAGEVSSRQWTNLPSGDYYLGINTPDTGPYCCLDGDIEVTQHSNLSGSTCTQPPPGPLEILHGALDVTGLIPALGIIPDAINAGIYGIEGDWINAGISAAAMIPIFGEGATLTRYGMRVSGEAVERVGRRGIEAGIRSARSVRVGSEFVQSVLASARRSVGDQSNALRKLQRRLGDPDSLGLFNHLPLTEEAAQGAVRQVLENAVTQRFGRIKMSGFAGDRGIAFFDSAGRGILVRQSDGLFITFLEEPRGLGNIFR